VTSYKVGERLFYIQGRYMIEIVHVKPFGFGGAQYRVKKLDTGRLGMKWVNHKKLSRLCSNSKVAQVLYSNKVTKAVENETDEV